MGFAGDYEVRTKLNCLLIPTVILYDNNSITWTYHYCTNMPKYFPSDTCHLLAFNNHRGFFFFSSSFTTGRYNRAYPGTATQLFSHGAATNLSSWRRASASYSRWLSYFFFLMCLWYNYLTHRLVRVAHFPPPPWPVPSMPVAAAWKCWHMRLGNTLSGLTGWHTLTPDNESYLRLERESLRTCGLVKI